MIQWLLFNGVNLQRGGSPVAKAIEFSFVIHANEAKARLSRMDVAMAGAEVAVHSTAWLRLPPSGFVQLLCLLEDLQFAHEGNLLPPELYASPNGGLPY